MSPNNVHKLCNVISQYTECWARAAVRPLRRRVEEAQDALVHGKHDGSARHGSKQMRSQAAVETHEALFLPHQLEALYQASVLEFAVCERCLTKSSSRNLTKALVITTSPHQTLREKHTS